MNENGSYEVGRFGRMRHRYLRNHKRILFTHLLTSGELYEHICDIDRTAQTRHEQIVAQMMQAQGVTEQLKAHDQMQWLCKVNNIRACADEIIHRELIYA